MITVEVLYLVGDTPQTDRFTSDRASCRMYGDGRGTVHMVGGRDDHGPVDYAGYDRAARIIRRPEEGQ